MFSILFSVFSEFEKSVGTVLVAAMRVRGSQKMKMDRHGLENQGGLDRGQW